MRTLVIMLAVCLFGIISQANTMNCQTILDPNNSKIAEFSIDWANVSAPKLVMPKHIVMNQGTIPMGAYEAQYTQGKSFYVISYDVTRFMNTSPVPGDVVKLVLNSPNTTSGGPYFVLQVRVYNGAVPKQAYFAEKYLCQ